jgi:SHS2 domain-containing protein
MPATPCQPRDGVTLPENGVFTSTRRVDPGGPVGHSWGEHVGELELRLEAADEAGVFAATVPAIAELLAGDEDRDAEQWFDLVGEGDDRAVLLAAWIEELVFLAEHEGVVPVAVNDIVLAPTSVRGSVGGYRGHPPHLVKAVTYHRLAFEPATTGWQANVVLDV